MLVVVGSQNVRVNREDRMVMGGDIRQWLNEVADPHEFATSFVDWAEMNPDMRGTLFPLIRALDYWSIFDSLEGFTG